MLTYLRRLWSWLNEPYHLDWLQPRVRREYRVECQCCQAISPAAPTALGALLLAERDGWVHRGRYPAINWRCQRCASEIAALRTMQAQWN